MTTGYLVIILNVPSHSFPGGLILNFSLLASMVRLGPSSGIIDKVRLKKSTARLMAVNPQTITIAEEKLNEVFDEE